MKPVCCLTGFLQIHGMVIEKVAVIGVGWWFGIPGIPLSNNPFHMWIPGIQTTGPQTNNLPLAEYLTQSMAESLNFWGLHTCIVVKIEFKLLFDASLAE